MSLQQFMGTKIVQAERMSEHSFLRSQGKEMPVSDDREGYKVEYTDGYQSWSPKIAFELAYRSSGELTFGMAIEYAKMGSSIARKGWNGTGMHLEFVQPTADDLHCYLQMKRANEMYFIWTPNMLDLFAQDWEVVE